MIKLYIDFDGVILDTITSTAKEMNEKGIVTFEEKKEYFEKLDWDKLLASSPEINNGISHLNELNNSKYFDVYILTHCYSEEEKEAKKRFMKFSIPNIKTIYVPVGIKKDQYVDSNNAVLVDDYLPNIISWEEQNGIGIKFSSSNKEVPYLRIKSLDEIFSLYGIILSRKKKKREKKVN